MKDKVVLVTGATSGIGLETAREIARQGATTVLVGRDEAKTRAVVSEIGAQTGNDNVAYLLADLSSIASTRAMAAEFLHRYPRLDVLVNNAGAFFQERGETEDGFERTFALNHLVGYFLLTNLLLDRLVASAPARIVNVSSDAHAFARMDFDDLQSKRKYSGWRTYSQSKLANVMFTYELARRLMGSGVTVNALHPGFVASNFGRTNNKESTLTSIGFRISQIFAISPQTGAETSIYLATSPEVEGVTGVYFEKKKPKRSSRASYNVDDQVRLWKASEQLLKAKAPAKAEHKSGAAVTPSVAGQGA